MGLARGFGQAIFGTALQDDRDRGGQCNPMTRGNVQRFGTGARAQDCTNDFRFVNKGLPIASLIADLCVLTD